MNPNPNPPDLTRPERNTWLVSYSAGANEWIREELYAHECDTTSPTSLKPFVLHDNHAATPKIDAFTCAVVLVIERDALDNPQYRSLVLWLMMRCAVSGYLGLFPILYGFGKEAREDLERQDTLLEDLSDCIQWPDDSSTHRLAVDLRRHVDDTANLRAAAFVHNKWSFLNMCMAWIAALAQLASIAFLLLAGMSALGMASRHNAELYPARAALVGLTSGIVAFPLIALTCFALLHRRTEHKPLHLLAFCIASWTCYLLVMTAQSPPLAWLLPGIATGVLLEIGRRRGLRVSRQWKTLDKLLASQEVGAFAEPFIRSFPDITPNPLTCPLLPETLPHVFISYTSKSTKSEHFAQCLRAHLTDAGIKAWMSKTDVMSGSYFRRTLYRKLGEANVFIGVLDKKAVQQLWPAIELETAIESRRLTGLPRIILLLHPELATEESRHKVLPQKILPVFQEVLNPRHAVIDRWQVEILQATDSSIELLTRQLHLGQFRSDALIPFPWSQILLILTLPVSISLWFLGTSGTLLGQIAGVVALLQLGDVCDLVGPMKTQRLLIPGALVLFYWYGFVLRLALASLYEVAHRRSRGLTAVNFAASVGIILMVGSFEDSLETLVRTWMIIIAYFGYFMAGEYIRALSWSQPDLLRPMD